MYFNVDFAADESQISKSAGPLREGSVSVLAFDEARAPLPRLVDEVHRRGQLGLVHEYFINFAALHVLSVTLNFSESLYVRLYFLATILGFSKLQNSRLPDTTDIHVYTIYIIFAHPCSTQITLR